MKSQIFYLMKYQIIIVFLFLSIHCGANTQSSLKSRIWYVKQNDFKSTDFGSGTNKQPFKTISKAASQALPGDTVLIFNGIYREHVAPENGGLPGKPIVYICLLYTSDAADEEDSVDLGGR